MNMTTKDVVILVLDYLRVLVWPAVVIVTMVVFRRQLVAILDRLRKADFPGGVSLDFAQNISEARRLSDLVKEVPLPPEKQNAPTIPLTRANARMIELGLRPLPSGLDMTYYGHLAQQDPALALAGLRIELETIARNVALGFKVPVTAADTGNRLLRKLRDAGAVTTDQMELAQRILSLCNAAIHGRRYVSLDEANEVIDAAKALAEQYLRYLSWGFGGDWRPEQK